MVQEVLVTAHVKVSSFHEKSMNYVFVAFIHSAETIVTMLLSRNLVASVASIKFVILQLADKEERANGTRINNKI